MPNRTTQFALLLVILIGGCAILSTHIDDQASQVQTAYPTPSPQHHPTPTPQVTWRVETVIERAEFPVSLAFTPDGHMLWTENQLARVQIVDLSDPQRTQHTLFQLYAGQDPAHPINILTGITLDPNFEENGYLYIYWIQPQDINPDIDVPIAKVTRFTLHDDLTVTDPVDLLALPIDRGTTMHRTGNLRFDAEGHLWVGSGDGDFPALAQDKTAFPGGVHRFQMNDTQLVPAPGNPFPGSSKVVYGLRNPFDFDFDPVTGNLIIAENGPHCDDEVNLGLLGGNYGWRPDYPCDDRHPQDADRYVYPMATLNPSEGISGLLVYHGDMFPQWRHDIFFCAFNQGMLRHAVFDANHDRILNVARIPLGEAKCQMDVEQGPEGALYFTDLSRIYRLVAK